MAKIGLNTSISTRVFWLSMFTGMVVLMVIALSSLSIFNSVFDELHKDKTLAIINSFDAGIKIDYLEDSQKMQNLINKFIYLSPDIDRLSINVVDKNNNLTVRASNNIDLLGQGADQDNMKVYVEENMLHERTVLANGDLAAKIVAPIILGGKKIGTYEMYLSLQKSWTEFRNKIIVYLSVISVLVLLASIGFYLVVRQSVVLPIKRLVEAVSKRGAGDFDYKIEVRSNDEIGKLEFAFNETGTNLADLYNNLDEKVKERTEKLNLNLELIKKQNESLESNKKAILNILEDEKELEIALKQEKESVEEKVRQRTQELSDTKAKLSASIENLPLGFLMSDIREDLIITNALANQALEGRNTQEKLLNLKNILKDKIDLSAYIKSCGVNKNSLSFEDIQIDNRYFHFMLSPILTENIEEICLGIVVLIQDVTEAKILNRSKDEFFSIASHELRTPLTAIRGNTSMIQEYYKEELKNPELADMISDIHESSIRLINIVNDFLNVSRLEQGKMEYKITDFDITQTIPNVISEYNVTGSRQKLSIEFISPSSPLPQVSGDSDKVRQILVNLIGNALKFTQEGGVKVSLENDSKFVKVLITDTGRGIAPEQQNLLFRKFQQAGENIFTRDTTKGTGLGLYISKMMIEGMGGSIKLEKSVPSEGSVFSFSLPIAIPGVTSQPA